MLLLLVSTAVAQVPQIAKVDPPNWFIGLPNPMLLIKGKGLKAAQVTVSWPGVSVVRTEGQRTAVSQDEGDYLFLWLNISASSPLGDVPIKITNGFGSTEFKFALTRRRPLSDGFRGFDGNDVIYLIMPDRFADGDLRNDPPPQSPGSFDRHDPRAYHGGDLRGITEHLDYLKALGVTTIWITPIYQNDPARRDYHGYGAFDLYAVDTHLGTLEDYKDLVAAAHRTGLKVLLDMVPNHVGPTNPWVNDPPDAAWFHGTRQQHLAAEGNFAPITDPHSLPSSWEDVTKGWFANILPDMDTENTLVKQYLIQNAMWWAEEGALDGFRLDTFPYVDRQFWHSFHAALHAAYPNFKTVGECFNGDPTIVSYFAGGVQRDGVDTGLDTPFDFPLSLAARDVIAHNAAIRELENTLRLDRLYPHPERLVMFEGNHDMARFMTEAQGDSQKLKLAFAILLTMRGTPQIYYGDEIGMEGANDPDNRHDFPGGFPGDNHDAFTDSGRTPVQESIFRYVQSLLRVRAEHQALRTGDLQDIFVDDTAYIYIRHAGDDRVLIALNNSDHNREIVLPPSFQESLSPILGAPPACKSAAGLELQVPARSAAFYLAR